ncbi:MAG: DUF1365 domain-containing protein [Acidobacteria bacterium]|nr:DUF1365 domain-containing protein [Acidobacteriota bacterium]
MNSCLYECQIMHQRFLPQRYGFVHRLFMFYLDLDELEQQSERLRWFSLERWNLFSFRAADHLQIDRQTTKASLLQWLAERGVRLAADARVMLLTHMRVLGYVFNPVSFYFCFDTAGQPLCAVAEVNNTFGETKLYLLDPGTWRENAFQARQSKHFYISPFLELDVFVDFDLRVPTQSLRLRIDDYDGGATTAQRILATCLTGTAQALTDGELLRAAFRFPLVTMQVIALIHWHALRLWWKGMPWHAKAANPELQKGILHGKSRSSD